MSKEVYRRLSKAERKLENTNRLRTNNSTLRIKYEGVKKILEKKDKEIERLNKIRQQVIDELFELKDMIYKPETREINFDVQRKISSMIVKLGSDKE